MNRRFLLTAVVALTGAIAAGQARVDFHAARDEAVRILQDLIRIDTSNPPGNETKAAEYLKALLEREQIPGEIVALEPSRGNLIARLKGSGRKPPLLLMAHTDVVGVERASWSVDPFAAVIKDGYVWGRGARDDKGMAAAIAEVMLLLARGKVALDRDVIFLAESGEEATTRVGVDYVVQNHWDKIAAEFALNEGGTIELNGDRVRFVGVATTEKVSRGIRLVARGTSGHGSMPRVDNAIVHLARAIAKLGDTQPPMRLNETTRTFFERLATISPPEQAALYRRLQDPKVQETLRQTSPEYNSMLRTSISPNIVQGGYRNNVIPSEARVTLDVRMRPDENAEAFRAELERLVDDDQIDVVFNGFGERPPGMMTPVDDAAFVSIERAIREHYGAPVVPTMGTGATDMAFLRAKRMKCFGIGPATDQEDGPLGYGAHSDQERILESELYRFVRFHYDIVAELAGAD
jgi:acetylornithine deacetylase/succinyl-diaminopimelate desuccinylase-like protein